MKHDRSIGNLVLRRVGDRLRRIVADDHGQTMALVALAMTVIVGTVALALDAGHAQYTYRQLQQTTDSAALAAARAVPTATMATQITGLTSTQRSFSSVNSNGIAAQYSAVTGGMNQRSSLPLVTVTTTLKCFSTLKAIGLPCIGNVPYNAVQVTSTSVMPTYFAGVLGHPSLTLSTTSTAAIRGGSPRPSNVAVIIDTTLSMNLFDTNCGYTQMQCSLNGFQILLKHLSPCGANQVSCNASNGVATNSFDRVALFTFPNVTASTAARDYNCTSAIQSSLLNVINDPTYGMITMMPYSTWDGIPTATAWTFPSTTATSYSPGGGSNGTYQITPFISDYRTSDAATTLNTSSILVQAAGAVPNCGGIAPSNYDGGYGTYYAGAIYAAQAALLNAQSSNPGSENVMIILGDGDSHAPGQTYTNWIGQTYTTFPSPANNSGTYPSWVNQCQQAVTAAQAAYTAGTLVYTVAYGSSAITGCGLDTAASPYLNNPCNAMAAMASAPQLFYSDWKQTGSDGTCTSSQPVTSLNAIFSSIANDLTQARLIPNNTT